MDKVLIDSLWSDFDATVDIAVKEGQTCDTKWIIELHDLRSAIRDTIAGRRID